MSASIGQLIPELQPFARDLVNAAGAAGLQPRVTSTRRSGAEQARLYRRSLQGMQTYPVAPPGTSAHEFGYAFDMVVTPMDALPDVGRFWEEMGGVWGGEFNDPIHFEYPGFKASGLSRSTGQQNIVVQAAEFIDSLPWYLSMWLPATLLTTTPNENMDDFAARVFAYLRKIGVLTE